MGAHRSGLVVLAGAVLAASACTPAPEPRPQRSTAPAVSSTPVDTATDTTIDVVPGAQLRVSPGDFPAQATVTVAASTAPPVDVSWFTASTAPVDIDLSAAPAADLELSWDGGQDLPADAIPVVLRYDADLGWYPIAAAKAPGAPATAARKLFSPHAFGFITDWSDAVAGGVRSAVGDRSDPLTCAGPPAWVDFTPASQDVVHTCATTNIDPATGTPRVEVQLRNNRGVAVEVLIPPGAAYAWVDGQPDVLREGWRALTGRDSVILPPGTTMSVGLTQPAKSGITQVTVTYSSLAILTTLMTQAAAGAPDTWYGVLAVLSSCSPHPALQATAEAGLDGLRTGVQVLLGCAQNLLGDPQAVATIATDWVARTSGVDAATAAADRVMAARIDKVAGTLSFLGGAVATVTLSSKVMDAIADAYVFAQTGQTNSLSPQVGMRAARPAQRPTPGLTGTAIGPLRLGTPVEELLGRPDLGTDTDDPGCYTALFGSLGGAQFAVLTEQSTDDAEPTGPVVAAWLMAVDGQSTDTAPRTAAGVGLGTGRADLEKRHPGGRWNEHPEHWDITATYTVDVDGAPVTFGLIGDTVTGLAIGVDYFPLELCG